MNYHTPSKCPVCGNTMEITKLHCGHCSTEISGSFSQCKFCTLEDKHMQFIDVFLRCRGNIKEVEKALGVSYPTVRNMIDAALSALYEPDEQLTGTSTKEEIMDMLSKKEIDVETAVQMLSGLKKGER